MVVTPASAADVVTCSPAAVAVVVVVSLPPSGVGAGFGLVGCVTAKQYFLVTVLSSLTAPRLISPSRCSHRQHLSVYKVTPLNSRFNSSMSPVKLHCTSKNLTSSTQVFLSTALFPFALAIRQLSIELAPDSFCCLALARFGFEVWQTNTVSCFSLSDQLSTLAAISNTN